MTTASVLLVGGSLAFMLGASVGVPQVFLTPDRDERLRLLTAHAGLWRLGQPFYAAGALVAALGVGWLCGDDRASGWWLAVAGAVMVLGAAAWSWSTWLRGRDPVAFVRGELPGWPFAIYIWSTILGLLLGGVGLLVGSWPGWLAWLVLAADALYVAIYLRTHDLPPFVFYLLLLVVGVAG